MKMVDGLSLLARTRIRVVIFHPDLRSEYKL